MNMSAKLQLHPRTYNLPTFSDLHGLMMTLSYNIQMKPVLVPVFTLRVDCFRSQMVKFGLVMGTVGALESQCLLASNKIGNVPCSSSIASHNPICRYLMIFLAWSVLFADFHYAIGHPLPFKTLLRHCYMPSAPDALASLAATHHL